jgi:hypothetical protein
LNSLHTCHEKCEYLVNNQVSLVSVQIISQQDAKEISIVPKKARLVALLSAVYDLSHKGFYSVDIPLVPAITGLDCVRSQEGEQEIDWQIVSEATKLDHLL